MVSKVKGPAHNFSFLGDNPTSVFFTKVDANWEGPII